VKETFKFLLFLGGLLLAVWLTGRVVGGGSNRFELIDKEPGSSPGMYTRAFDKRTGQICSVEVAGNPSPLTDFMACRNLK
jgi:hypothetical protein